jgi:hypothetical protein
MFVIGSSNDCHLQLETTHVGDLSHTDHGRAAGRRSVHGRAAGGKSSRGVSLLGKIRQGTHGRALARGWRFGDFGALLDSECQGWMLNARARYRSRLPAPGLDHSRVVCGGSPHVSGGIVGFYRRT